MTPSDANRRALRSAFQFVVALAAGLPLIVSASGVSEAVPGVGLALAVALGVTRVMALPVVDKLLPSWLRAAGPDPALSAAYRERAQLLALLATVYPSHMQPDPTEPDWPVLYLGLPTGQATWHIAPDDVPLFGHVRRDITEPWDGHTTDEKYERVAAAAAQNVSRE